MILMRHLPSLCQSVKALAALISWNYLILTAIEFVSSDCLSLFFFPLRFYTSLDQYFYFLFWACDLTTITVWAIIFVLPPPLLALSLLHTFWLCNKIFHSKPEPRSQCSDVPRWTLYHRQLISSWSRRSVSFFSTSWAFDIPLGAL